MLSEEQLNRYSRQAIMPEINEEGQERLLSSKVTIIGAGGLGCPVGLYLSGAGIGKISIIDDDIIELSNLNRQIAFSTNDINKSKSAMLKKNMFNLNPSIKIESKKERLNIENINNLLKGSDLVIDCSDNFETRHLIASYCFNKNIPMSFGAAVRQEGQTAFFQAGCKNEFENERNRRLPCYGCVFPIEPSNELMPRCSEAGILGPVTGLIACIQSLNVIRYLTIQSVSKNLILWDGVSFFEIKIEHQITCPICSIKAKS